VIFGVITLVAIIYYYSKHLVKVGKRIPKANKKVKQKHQNVENSNAGNYSNISKIYLSKAFSSLENPDIFLKELNFGIDEYIQEKFQIEKHLHSKEEIVEMLNQRGVPLEIAQNYLILTNKISQIRFSHLQKTQQDLDLHKVFSLVGAYINELENYLE
jgi:hypothetical protein